MAGRKSTRSSKTDHVLNLLADPSSEPTPSEPAAPAEKAEAKPAAAAEPVIAAEPVMERRLTPPILEVAKTNNEALEETIHSALEDALQESLAQEVSAQEPPTRELSIQAMQELPIPEEMDAVPSRADEAPMETHAAEQQAVIPSDVSTDPEEPAAPIPPQAPAPASAQAAPIEDTHEPLPFFRSLPDDTRFVNVMLPLVQEKLERYVKMFHLCDCPRCLADAEALTLSRLPAKYVVLPESAFTPMMSLYRAKYDSMITTQVVYACKQVMDTPRHHLENS